MEKYSFKSSESKRKVVKVIRRATVFHLKYQNTVWLLLSFLFTYALVKTGLINTVVAFMGNFGYLSALVLGFFFSLGFTTTPASATLFYLARRLDPWWMSVIAAIGAAFGNMTIYLFVKHKLLGEIRNILSEDFRIEFAKFEIKLNYSLAKNKWARIFVPALAGILTALPIPTEIIAAMLWNIVKYNPTVILLYSFIFDFLGILALALFGASR